MMESRSRGVLDRPVKPCDDGLLWSCAVLKPGDDDVRLFEN
jgi:hypothetical protein